MIKTKMWMYIISSLSQERADPESKETKKLYMAVLDRENTFVKVQTLRSN